MRLLVAYDGSAFHGFARNPGVATVAEALEERLSAIMRVPISVTGAGRTDRGVHAWGQVVTFDAPADRLDPPRLARSLNAIAPHVLAVRSVAVVDDDFDARFSARWRRYRYTVLNAEVPDPFLSATAWRVGEPLDLAAMRSACVPLVGEHDFTSFCKRPPSSPGAAEPRSLVRRVLGADWDRTDDDLLRFEITASAFCHQMVRSVVGMLVDVGRGRRKASDVAHALAARDRSAISNVAPPHGLCLWEVGYD